MSYTPAVLQSILGLVNNQGLTNSRSIGLCSSYSATGTVAYAKSAMDAAYNSYISSTLKTTIYQIGSTIAPFLTGGIPSAYLGVLTSSYHLPTIIVNQSNKIFANGSISGFIQNFGKCTSVTSSSKDLITAANISMNSSFNSYGGNSFSNSASFGFKQILPTNVTFSTLGSNLQKLGNIYNLKTLTKINDPVNLITTIYNKDIQSIGDLDTKIKSIVDPALLTSDSFQTNSILDKKLITALSEITNKDALDQYKLALGINSSVVINNLSDLVYPERLLTNLSTTLAAVNFSLLPNLAANLSSISTFDKLGKALSSMEDVPTLSTLDQSTTPFSSADLTQLQSLLPIYDPSVGPKVTDLIGVVSGYTCAEFSNIATVVNNYSGSYHGVNIIANYFLIANTISYWDGSDLTSNITGWKNNIESAMSSIVNSGDINVTTSNTNYNNIAGNLYNQMVSLTRANIDLTSVSLNNKQSLMSFGPTLTELGRDRKDIGIKNILPDMCDTSKYGQAIRLALIEGKNLQVVQSYGENPPNLFKVV